MSYTVIFSVKNHVNISIRAVEIVHLMISVSTCMHTQMEQKLNHSLVNPDVIEMQMVTSTFYTDYYSGTFCRIAKTD